MQDQNVSAAPFSRSASISGATSRRNHNNIANNHLTAHASGPRSRPSTSHGEREATTAPPAKEPPAKERPKLLTKDRDRKPSFTGLVRRASFSGRRRGSVSNGNAAATGGGGGHHHTPDDGAPPALPEHALANAAKFSKEYSETTTAAQNSSPASVDSFSRMLSRTAPTSNGFGAAVASPPLPTERTGSISTQGGLGPQNESSIIYQHIQEIANKRISTLDYLRKAHEGRVYWFNTLLFDKPDLARMPYFDSRKLARRATNYLLLGLSLPTVIDLNSSTPLEFLRSLNTLLTEFDSFQQIHSENGINASSLSRARLPQMFRRGPGGKGRRTSGAGDLGYIPESGNAGGGGGGGGGGSMGGSNSVVNQTPTSVISFGLGGEGNDLLPGEEYTHLLTPSLPFDPDFFETFATLCDVLIDCYTRLMSLIPSSWECTPPIAELFTKADARVRKIIIQGVVKEFEDSSRAGLKQEVGNVSKVVLGGLM
ncbi:WD domain-containing protein [Apiospora arundinis]|uniref:WD domain-containing protein n=1 Tax=Apiospora arundinis TaxID=335852 RepID=A0ABR2JIN3_9PEZI